ncbi:helix-turn-helix transcriptional regulator [Streptomyces minutiscleroticus]|uniref:helix-turn-helix transcriptional regulator n=1 Tax=Streptomyces minutiscleroticus TaxID=68238 RepID=UPI0033263494
MALLSGAEAEGEPRLVGRDLELSLIHEHLSCSGRAVLLRGTAGIGKTRLMRAVLTGLAGDAQVLTAKCAESGSGPYGTVRALFGALGLPARSAEGADDGAGHPLLRGSARLALPALAPDRTPDGAPADGYAVMHGLYWLTAGLAAERPLVLAVDDLQWCDEASLRWLGFLLRRAEDLRVVLLLTLRTETGPPLPDVLDEMADAAGCLTVDVEPLPEKAVGDLLTAALGTAPAPGLVATCAELTGGTPFLVQLMADGIRELSALSGIDHAAVLDGLGHRVVARHRIDGLAPDRLAVARAAAVLEGHDIETVAALAGTRPGPACGAVEDLRAAGLLRPDSLEYRHDLIRDAVLNATPYSERTALRARAAGLLNDSGRPTEEVAAQLMLLPGVPEPWMVTVLRAAALGAEQRGAPAAAAQYLGRALRHAPDDVELLSVSARTLVHSDPRAALRHLEHALSLDTDPRTRCLLVLQYAVTSLAAQNSLRAFELVDQALESTGTELGDSPADRALRTRMEAMLLVSGLDEKSTLRRVGERFRDQAPPRGETAEERQQLGMLAALRTLQGRPAAEVVPAAAHVLRAGDVGLGGWAVLGASVALYLADEIEPVDTVLTTLLEHARGRGEAWTAALVASTRAQVRLWAGDVRQSLSDGQFSFDVLIRELRVRTAVTPYYSLALPLVHRGEAHRAQEVLDLVARPRLDQFTIEHHSYLMARGRVRAALGDLEGALEHLLRCGESLDEAGIAHPLFAPWWFDAGLAFAGLGRPGEGLDVAERVAASVERWGTARARGMLTLVRGALTPGDAGVELLGESARVLDGTPGRLEHARAEYLLGRRLLDRGDTEGARERLRRAIDRAVLCGDRLLLSRARPALAAAGGRLRRGTASPVDSLSGSERQVAERAAGGATNREIAEAMFLSQRTVEFHLTSVYRKLGIRRRQELTEALSGLRNQES